MADQIIVATFNNTNAAYDAASALKALKDKGVTDPKVKAGVMVKKDDLGNLSLLETKDRLPGERRSARWLARSSDSLAEHRARRWERRWARLPG